MALGLAKSSEKTTQKVVIKERNPYIGLHQKKLFFYDGLF